MNEPVLRFMEEADLPMLHEWLNRPHVVQWWGGEDARPSMEHVRAHYHPRVMAADNVTPYIVLLDGRPVGYSQSYVAMGSGDGWWEDETDPGVRGVDQFIAEPSLLNQGLGTRMLSVLLRNLFADPKVTRLQTDPDPANLRAVRCYEKAGFKAIRTITTPDGPALYMVRERGGV